MPPSSSDRRAKLSQFIRTSSGVINTQTGEIITSPRQQELNKYQYVKPEITSKRSSSATPKKVDTSAKTKLSGRDIARQRATGDIYAENLEDRPTGRARENYFLKYVLKERLRKQNARMLEQGKKDEVIPLKGKQYERNARAMLLDFKSRFPGIPVDEADIMHVNPIARGGKNAWTNLRMGPRKLNLDQNISHPSPFRQLPAEEARRFGALGYGTGSTWEGIPEEREKMPRTQINPRTGLRNPVGPTKALPGIANMLLEPLMLAGIAGVRDDVTLRDAVEYFKNKYNFQGPPSSSPML